MKAHLLYPNADFTAAPLEKYQLDLVQDLELNVLLNVLSNGDPFLFEAVRSIVLDSQSDLAVLSWRQAILHDCLKNQEVVRRMYALTVQAIDQERKNYLSQFMKHPSFVIGRSTEVIEMFLGILLQLRRLAEDASSKFESPGFGQFLALLQTELNDEFLALVKKFLEELKFPRGVLISAKLGVGFKADTCTLRRLDEAPLGWINRIKTVLSKRPPSFKFTLADRDERSARALSDLYDRGINQVANALAQSTDHLLGFLAHLRTELAFYVAAIHLKEKLDSKKIPWSFPELFPAHERRFETVELHDPCLAFTLDGPTQGNALEGDGQNLAIITGANQGGKSTFLRSVGLALLLAQSGLFVTAKTCKLSVSLGLFTHFRRKEDANMTSGKLDEELARMNAFIEKLGAHAVVLLNESFAATNEREGSEIASQIVEALLERKIRVFFVTHQYELARRFFEKRWPDVLFLQAEVKPDASRTFRLLRGVPQPSSHGLDLYKQIFS